MVHYTLHMRAQFADLVANRVRTEETDNPFVDVADPSKAWTPVHPVHRRAPRPPLPVAAFDQDLDIFHLFQDVAYHFRQFGFLDTSTCDAFSSTVVMPNARWVEEEDAEVEEADSS